MIRFGEKGSIPELKKLWSVCFGDEDAYINAFFASMYADRHVLMAAENGVLMGASFFLPGKIYVQDDSGNGGFRVCDSPGNQQHGNLLAGRCRENQRHSELFADGYPQDQRHSELSADGYPQDQRHENLSAGRWQEIRYVYALAVYPQFRGKGIAAGLLRRAAELFQAPLVAEPANEGLIRGFYGPLGFSPSFYLEKRRIALPAYDIQAAEIHPYVLSAEPADAGRYHRIREEHLKKHGFVSWPKCHTAFALQEHCASGGGAFVVTERSRTGLHGVPANVRECAADREPVPGPLEKSREDILLYYMEQGTAVVTETTLEPDQAIHVLTACLAVPCDSVELMLETSGPDREPNGKGMHGREHSEYKLTGMAYGMPPIYGYLNLSLD